MLLIAGMFISILAMGLIMGARGCGRGGAPGSWPGARLGARGRGRGGSPASCLCARGGVCMDVGARAAGLTKGSGGIYETPTNPLILRNNLWRHGLNFLGLIF